MEVLEERGKDMNPRALCLVLVEVRVIRVHGDCDGASRH